VIHNHGGPSSRLEAGLFEDAASKHGLRLVCVDRPGIGQSSPQDPRSFSRWADRMKPSHSCRSFPARLYP
jgi:pimeloyl-ACP methyl ester carboxylesterase